MKKLVSTTRIAVLIPTHSRPALLRRALRSVSAQSRQPESLIIVFDEANNGESTPALDEFDLAPGMELITLFNRRTSGLSGALNSGIDEIARREDDHAATFVAVLDDDDWWEPSHLSRCLDTALQENADVAAAHLIRHDDTNPDGRPLSSIPTLDAQLALERNTGIQGSNLFVRLRTLLEAGLFDEALKSTTDRDLVIRLADLHAHFVAVKANTVHHCASNNRPRLSTPGSNAKFAGLRMFYHKYSHRMTAEQRVAFWQRSSELFGIIESSAQVDFPKPPAPELKMVADAATDATPLHLVVGITADSDETGAARVSKLLEDLAALQPDPRLATLDVLLLENGAGNNALVPLAERMNSKGMHCRLARADDQFKDAANGIFGANFKRTSGRIGIADSRTMLQHYARHIASEGSVVWIIDDDKRLTPLTLQNERLVRTKQDTIGQIIALRDSGADVVLGVDTGAAPLPVALTLSLQLVDLQASLFDLLSMHPDESHPNRAQDNFNLVNAVPTEFYHSLARDPVWHLEQPFGFVPTNVNATARDMFIELCNRAPRIFAGEQVFRPLFVDPTAPLTLQTSVHRGGNTLFIDLDALVDVPQSVPEIDGRPSRRSDMVSAILNSAVRGRRVERASFAVYHDRSDLAEHKLDVETLVDDIRGFALYSTLNDLIRDGVQLEQTSQSTISKASQLYQKYLRERSAAMTLSLNRARGAMRTAQNVLSAPNAWWWTDPECAEATQVLSRVLKRQINQLDHSLVNSVNHAIDATPRDTMAVWLGNLGSSLHIGKRLRLSRPDWLAKSRVEKARMVVELLSSPNAPLKLLGYGDEGVVFTDSTHTYKCMDRWRSRASNTNRDFLRSLIGAWSDTTALLPLLRLDESADGTVLVMPYRKGSVYQGGHGAGLVKLLYECRKNGIAFRNMHPKNLLVVGNDVCLIDYGLDILPLNEVEWKHMVRRTWLCWRWTKHPDIEQLMTRALKKDPPEIHGWERLEQAVLGGNAKEELDALILGLLHANDTNAQSNLLDYGCGAGMLVNELAQQGTRVVGFDPHHSRHWKTTKNADYTTNRNIALAAGPYDTVVCSLVLCTLNDVDYQQTLADLRTAVRDGGRVLIAVCHPFHTHGGDTPYQSRIEVPALKNTSSDATFTWTKRVRQTGNIRHDVHRPLHILRRDLLRAGIVIESTNQTETIDFNRFEPASDFLVLQGRAVPPGPRVSLLIRAAALEWRTLDKQIRHLVLQLETPRAFCERVVVLDTLTTGFTRSYDVPDITEARATLDRLVLDGTIDRVVEPPTDTDSISALHHRWFDKSVPVTHSVNGAPVTSALTGFEVCTSDYILHVDDDLLILRRDPTHDILTELANELTRDAHAVSASMPIVKDWNRPWNYFGSRGTYGVEVRGTLLDRSRLNASRSWPNEVTNGMLSLSWHRSLDKACTEQGLRSLRGGLSKFGFIHPENTVKKNVSVWLSIMDRVEQGHVPEVQNNCVNLTGSAAEWFRPLRTEPLVVIACGRNVPAGRVARFKQSIEDQSIDETGLVVIEDGGSLEARDVVHHHFVDHPCTSLFTLPNRRGALSNFITFVPHICPNPDTIIVLVDLDDALLGCDALAHVMKAFNAGHDLAIGGMRRTDKSKCSSPCFDNPRANRGGNVWQHLRAFKRSLIDHVPESALRDETGQYFDLASDWAIMIALSELAQSPCALKETLYLHEPSGHGKTGTARENRENTIGRILAMPSLTENRVQ